MKKVLFTLAVLATIAVQADYLYWMVDTPQTGTDISGNETTFTWATAKLYADSELIGTLTAEDAGIYQLIDSYAISGDVGNYTDYATKTFFIELFNSDNSWMAQSSKVSGSSLAQYMTGSMSMNPPSGPWTGGTYSIPEPTSGLLFLVGGMLLGLKRRRQKV